MDILPKNWIPYGRTLYLKDYDTLIVSDIHLGKCISTNSTISYSNKYNRLKKILDNTNPETLILNGDIFYCSSNYFDNQLIEDKKALKFLSKLNNNVCELILLKGNHELVLGGFTNNIKSSYNTKDYHVIDDILIQHGHSLEKSNKKINHHIIGHIHPSVNEKGVFHYCEKGYKNNTVTILPSFCKYVNTANINYYDGVCPLFEKGTMPHNYESLNIRC